MDSVFVVDGACFEGRRRLLGGDSSPQVAQTLSPWAISGEVLAFSQFVVDIALINVSIAQLGTCNPEVNQNELHRKTR